MKQVTTRILYRYWNDVRGHRLAPARFDIEPSRIGGVLSETFIIERVGQSYPFRLAGTKVCEQIGRELRGIDFLDLASDDRRALKATMASVTSDGGVAVLEFEGETVKGRTVTFEALVLPLTHPDNEVTRYLGSFSAIDPPAWLGAEPVVSTVLLAHNVVWPDGRPHQMAAISNRQLPFSPDMAAARIVRSQRRQFRILEGGRKE